ncbi:PREDICTED: uncharacterized protein LOC100632316 [Amphimedon queenslandica]|uniref:Caveolin n=1 Tax=Amphimedon queenslandica TaxID=400682 RepID=A0A1X7VPY7_AMPQE|nr:PREDICTED: uncharacterized protein LOC100632316 [Amphimedon queenslandica]|eukprot:XP_003383143.1 PREDICTED: uncharacterized protein LOC100632316 [Amphimedon queenslandica]
MIVMAARLEDLGRRAPPRPMGPRGVFWYEWSRLFGPLAYQESDPTEPLTDLHFDKVFHEHKSTATIPQVRAICPTIFFRHKSLPYNVAVLIIGPWFLVLFAILAGVMAFVVTWILQPSIRLGLFVVGAVLPVFLEPLKIVLSLLKDVQARVFRQIRINASLGGSFNLDRIAASNV